MASEVVGAVLCVGLTFFMFGAMVVPILSWCNGEVFACSEGEPIKNGSSAWRDAAERCACEPAANEDGSMCQPVSLPDRFGVAWRCEIKPALMYPKSALGG